MVNVGRCESVNGTETGVELPSNTIQKYDQILMVPPILTNVRFGGQVCGWMNRTNIFNKIKWGSELWTSQLFECSTEWSVFQIFKCLSKLQTICVLFLIQIPTELQKGQRH